MVMLVRLNTLFNNQILLCQHVLYYRRSKLNLKVKNLNIEQLLKPKNTHNKMLFETEYLGENIKNVFKEKSNPICHHLFGILYLSKKSE